MEYDSENADRLGARCSPDGIFLCPGGKESPLTGRMHSLESMGLVDGPGVRAVVFLQAAPCAATTATIPIPKLLPAARKSPPRS